jgi:hypothetical protein
MGRGRLSLVAVGLLVAVVLLAVAGVGQAKSRGGGTEVQKALTSGYLLLGEQKGYELVLYMPSNRVVLFYAIRSDRVKGDRFGISYSIYAARNRGNLKDGVVRARFGSLGRVSLRFRPSGRTSRRDPRSGCEGGLRTTRPGRFVGHLRFRGEGDYFHVRSPEGKGFVMQSPRLECEKGQADPSPPRSLRAWATPVLAFDDRDSIALLSAAARSDGRSVRIVAKHADGAPPGADVQVAFVEPGHGMAIGHGAFLQGPAGTLLTSPPGAHPAAATLAPPAPFFGKATYAEEAGAWTGNFGVKLAGLRLPLTGPEFKVRLCVVNPLKDKDGCEFPQAKPLFVERPARPGWALR